MSTSTIAEIEHLLELLQLACTGAMNLCDEPSNVKAVTVELPKPVDLVRVDDLLRRAACVDPISRSELNDRWRLKLYLRSMPRPMVEALEVDDLGSGFWLYRPVS